MRISDWSSDVCSSDLMTSLQERGTMFLEPTTEVYEGMIVGENSRADDMDVNITKEKQQTNIRSATSDNFEKLIPPKKLSLEQCLEFCRDDECVEVTPDSVRIRKLVLDANARSEEHTSELQSLMRISYAVFCLKKTTHT